MPQIPSELNDFLDAYTWEESKRILLQNPELLDEESDSILDQMAGYYQFSVSKKGRTSEKILAHKKLLQSCRSDGIQVGFANKHGVKIQPLETLIRTFFYADSLDEIHSLINHYPELLDERVDDMIESVVGYSLTSSGNRAREGRRILLRLCREVGIDKAFHSSEYIQKLQETLIHFLHINEFDKSKEFLQIHPELLTTEVKIILDRNIEILPEPHHLIIARNVLENCKQIGISAAYAQREIEAIQEELSEINPNNISEQQNYVNLQANLGVKLLEIGEFDKAIVAFENSLNIKPPAQALHNYVGTHTYLARTHKTKGNLGRAIKILLTARELINKEEFPDLWGEIYYLLGICFTSLPYEKDSDKQEENQYEAIRCFLEALQVCDKTNKQETYGLICRWLGDAHMRMPNDSPAEARFNYSHAIGSYREALTVGEEKLSNDERIKILIGLSSAHKAFDNHKAFDRDKNEESLRKAVDYCMQALTLLAPQALYEEALLKKLLGDIFFQLSLIGDEGTLSSAKRYLNEALNLCNSESMEELRRQIAGNLGNIYFHNHEWQAAKGIFLSVLDDLGENGNIDYILSTSDEYAENTTIRQKIAFCLWQERAVQEAIEVLERSKASSIKANLVTQLVMIDSSKIMESDYYGALKDFKIAQQNMNHVRLSDGGLIAETRSSDWLAPIKIYSHKTPGGSHYVKLAEQYEQANKDYKKAESTIKSFIEQVSNDFPILQPYTLNLDNLKELIDNPNAAIVMPLLMEDEGVVFILSEQNIQTVPLPKLNHKILDDLVGWGRIPTYGNFNINFSTPSYGYLGAYFNKRNNHQNWLRMLDETLLKLGEIFWEPIIESLPQHIKQLMIIPQGQMWLLPLHAAQLSLLNKKSYVVDHYEISYFPSIEIISLCQRLAQQSSTESLYAIINPEEDLGLQWSWIEGDSICKLFKNSEMVRGREATRNAVFETEAKYNYIHIASHGRFNWKTPKESGLRMADAWITLEDILSRRWDLRGVRLLTLSACETSIIEVRQSPEGEYVSLPGSILSAGVPCVIGSLWAVDDISTSLLMQQFYKNHLDKSMSISTALHEAINWIRTASGEDLIPYFELLLAQGKNRSINRHLRSLLETYPMRVEESNYRFSHPYYWGAFVCVGC